MAGQDMTFAAMGRIEAIRSLFEGTPYKPFEEPLWFFPEGGAAVTTATCVFTEGIDFDLKYFPLKHLGYKSVVQTVGELYAVMAKARTLSVTISISAKLDYPQAAEIWSGIVSAALEHGVKSISLDLRPSRTGLLLSISASGEASKASCERRAKAESKDLICVSGHLGAAYLGQQLLEHKFSELDKYKMQAAAYLRPELGANTVERLEQAGICPSFGYFLKAGLADAVLRLTRDSGLGAKIYADKIPFEGNSFALGKELDIDPVSAAMNGGDDSSLLFTIPIAHYERFRHDFQDFNIIGHLAQSNVGAVLVTPEGVELPLKAQGYLNEAETL